MSTSSRKHTAKTPLLAMLLLVASGIIASIPSYQIIWKRITKHDPTFVWPIADPPNRSADKVRDPKIFGLMTRSFDPENFGGEWDDDAFVFAVEGIIQSHPVAEVRSVLGGAIKFGSLVVVSRRNTKEDFAMQEDPDTDKRIILIVRYRESLEVSTPGFSLSFQAGVLYYLEMYNHWANGGKPIDFEFNHARRTAERLASGMSKGCESHWALTSAANAAVCRYEVATGRIEHGICSYVDTPHWNQALFLDRIRKSDQHACATIAKEAGHPKPQIFRRK